MTGRRITLSKIILFLLAAQILVPRIRLGVSWLTLDDMIPLGAAILGMIGALQTRVIPRRWLLVFLAGWSFIGALSSMVNTDTISEFVSSFAKGALRPMNSFFIVVLTIKILKDNPVNVHFTLRWLARIATLLGSFAVLSYGLSFLTGSAFYGIEPWRGGSAAARLVPGRFVGTSNVASNFIGAYFLMMIPVTLALTLTARDRALKRFYFFGILVQLFGMIVTFTRSSLIALVVVTVGLLFLLKKKALIQILAGGGVVLGLIIGLAVPEYVLRFTSDGTGRLFLWSIGLRMMFDHPILGVGFNRYMTVVSENLDRYPVVYEPHNSWVMMGAEGGVLMFVLGILMVVVYAFTLFRGYRRNGTVQGQVLIAGLLAGSTGYLIQNMTNDILYLPHLTTYFWLFFSLAVNMPGRRPPREVNGPTVSPAVLTERAGA